MSDYKRLGELAVEMKETYISPRKQEWSNSPFSFLIPEMTIKDIGKFGEALLIRFGQEQGYNICSAEINNDVFDVWLNDIPVEVKFATQAESGSFIANQIRDQAYQYVIVFALTPTEVVYWVFTKDEAWSLGSWQHGTNEVKDTKMLSLRPTGKRKNKFSSYQVGNSLTDVVARIMKE